MISVMLHLIFFLQIMCVTAALNYPTIGNLTFVDNEFYKIFDANAQIEILYEGLEWGEGAVWIDSEKAVAFTDEKSELIFWWEIEKEKLSFFEQYKYNKPNGILYYFLEFEV